jgi:Ca2+-transporting ATPase
MGEDVPLGDRIDMAYMNSQVTRGRGEMVVTATGMSSGIRPRSFWKLSK